MAKIVQSLTRAAKEYQQTNMQSLVRDLDGIITKLNSSFQEEVKQEIEAKSFLTNAGVDLTGFDKEVLRQVEHRLI